MKEIKVFSPEDTLAAVMEAFPGASGAEEEVLMGIWTLTDKEGFRRRWLGEAGPLSVSEYLESPRMADDGIDAVRTPDGRILVRDLD